MARSRKKLILVCPPKMLALVTGACWARQSPKGGPIELTYTDGTIETTPPTDKRIATELPDGTCDGEKSDFESWFALVSFVQSFRTGANAL